MIVVTCACISQPQWFRLDGGGCSTHTVGLYLFFHPGAFEPIKGTDIGPSAPHLIYYTNGEGNLLFQKSLLLFQIVRSDGKTFSGIFQLEE